MQVSIETTSGLERRMTIVVPSETFEERVQQKLQETAKRVRLDGFRPGKVPLREVRRRFGKAVRQEVAGELMQNSFLEAVRDENVMPAGSPDLEVLNMDPGVDLEFTATFEVFPSIELARLTDVTVERPTAEITPEDVDKMVERLREQNKRFEPVDRPSQEGDSLTVDFVGRMDGEAFEGGAGTDVKVELGGGRMLPDFERGLTGLAPGTTHTFDVTFPDDYTAEELKGKTAQFEVTVKEVAEPRLPELDAEFLESFGIKEGGIDQFRHEVTESMKREVDGAVRNLLRKRVMQELDRLHDVQLPETLVQREIEGLKEQMLGQMRLPPGSQQPELPSGMFEQEARRRVKLGLVINEVVARDDLKPDPARVRAQIEQLAQGYAQPQQVIEFYYSNERQLQQIEMAVLEEQVIERIVEQAQVTDVAASYEDIITGATDKSPDDGAEGEAPPAQD
jgi:trigger factor